MNDNKGKTIIFALMYEALVIQSLFGGEIMNKTKDVKPALDYFKSTDNALLIVAGDVMLYGWSVPEANILFSKEYPDDPRIRAQALGRVRAEMSLVS
jgi:hypothetical protein